MVRDPLYLTIGIGSDYAYTTVSAVGTGVSTLTASTQGLSSAQASLQLAPNPLVTHHSSPSYIFENQTAVMYFSVSFLGGPLSGVNVTWAATGGQMSQLATKTGLSGMASSTFIPQSVGVENITATLSSPIGTTSVTYYLDVLAVPVKPPRTILQELMSFWYYIAAAAVAAIAAAFYMLRMRRKKQKAEIEAGFEVV
jgi:hypothetical protein